MIRFDHTATQMADVVPDDEVKVITDNIFHRGRHVSNEELARILAWVAEVEILNGLLSLIKEGKVTITWADGETEPTYIKLD